MAYRVVTALCPAAIHVRVYGYRFQPSLGYVSLVGLCVGVYAYVCVGDRSPFPVPFGFVNWQQQKVPRAQVLVTSVEGYLCPASGTIESDLD